MVDPHERSTSHLGTLGHRRQIDGHGREFTGRQFGSGSGAQLFGRVIGSRHRRRSIGQGLSGGRYQRAGTSEALCQFVVHPSR